MSSTLYLTDLQREELVHKTSILRDEPDLMESYEVTQEEADRLAHVIDQSDVPELSSKEAQILANEVDNLIEIALGNMDTTDTQERRRLAAYIGSMRSLLTKLEGIAP